MAESDIHKNLKIHALFYLKDKVVDIVANEVKFKNIRCVADAVGINLKRKEIRIIEVKASREDFFRDKKLFEEDTTYFNHAHYAYILCPINLIMPSEVPRGYGLLWLDEEDNIQVVKKPIKNTGKLKTRFETTLKRSVRRLSNALLYTKNPASLVLVEDEE